MASKTANPAAADSGARNADGAATGAGDPIDRLAARIKATEPLRPLLAQRRWVMWRYEARNGSKPSKAPYVAADPNRHASSKDPHDWCDFETAITSAKRHGFDGVSFALLRQPSPAPSRQPRQLGLQLSISMIAAIQRRARSRHGRKI
jgi:hypothetical protein